MKQIFMNQKAVFYAINKNQLLEALKDAIEFLEQKNSPNMQGGSEYYHYEIKQLV